MHTLWRVRRLNKHDERYELYIGLLNTAFHRPLSDTEAKAISLLSDDKEINKRIEGDENLSPVIVGAHEGLINVAAQVEQCHEI